MTFRPSLLLVLLTTLGCGTNRASRSDYQTLLDRLDELERRLEALEEVATSDGEQTTYEEGSSSELERPCLRWITETEASQYRERPGWPDFDSRCVLPDTEAAVRVASDQVRRSAGTAPTVEYFQVLVEYVRAEPAAPDWTPQADSALHAALRRPTPWGDPPPDGYEVECGGTICAVVGLESDVFLESLFTSEETHGLFGGYAFYGASPGYVFLARAGHRLPTREELGLPPEIIEE